MIKIKIEVIYIKSTLNLEFVAILIIYFIYIILINKNSLHFNKLTFIIIFKLFIPKKLNNFYQS